MGEAEALRKLYAVLETLKRISAESGEPTIHRAEYKLIGKMPVPDLKTARNHLEDLEDHGCITVVDRSQDPAQGWTVLLNSPTELQTNQSEAGHLLHSS